MLTQFSEPRVRDDFRIKICFDTNILNYYLNNEFPGLTLAIDEFSKYIDFLDLITTKYTLFELLEVRKRDFFEKNALKQYPQFGPLSEGNVKRFNIPNIAPPHYYNLLPQIVAHVKSELDLLRNHNDLMIDGTIHDSIWDPTIDICLNSRLSREDSLVLTSTLMPDELKIEDFLAVFTNDKDFNDFFLEAPGLEQVFHGHALPLPTLSYIQNLTNHNGTQFNLTDPNTIGQVPAFLLSYIKTLIIKKNSTLFIGKTDSTFSTNNPNIIGIRLLSNNLIQSTHYLTFIGNNLDFIITCPIKITDFRDSKSVTIPFPIDNSYSRIVFFYPNLDPSDPLKNQEGVLLASLKASDNLVFIHPDSI